MRKTGKLRRRYVDAAQAINRDGFKFGRDDDIAAFVKLERYFKESKAPRMIMGRNPKFGIFYSRFIERVEKLFFSLEQVANACDYKSCGEKFAKLVGQWFMGNDMESFEGSQRPDVLAWEYFVYYHMCEDQNEIDFLNKCFAAKLEKKGHTGSGVSFSFLFCRGSGDQDTSLGNGIINYVATQYFLIKNYCPDCRFELCSNPQCKTFKFVVKGDDSYSSIPRKEEYINTYEHFGLKAKIEIWKRPEDVEFCSGRFFEYQPGKFYFVQSLQKLVTSLTTVINEDVLKNGWVAHYYKSLGLMYRKLYKGVPIYSDLAEWLCRSSDRGLNINLIGSYNLLKAFENCDVGEGIVASDDSLINLAAIHKWDLAELDALKRFFLGSKLSFPPELNKRCNLRTARMDIPEFDFVVMTNEFMKGENTKTQKWCLKRVQKCARRYF